MSDLIPLREAADSPTGAEAIQESFIPLSEKAVRRDGTIGIKLIAPGWGSSGYYSPQILERDAPRVFGPGTQMFWNHDTQMEEAERPEGDLSRLAAVITSTPRYEANGSEGPGVYADARVMAGYAPVIDDIAEAIGLSIRAAGRYTDGEAEGRFGRIVQEITADPRVGSRVDFVTKPGAGGQILSIFEAAPHAPKLPDPTPVSTFLAEAGRVLSKANETKLKAALEQLTAVLALLDSEATSESLRRIAEARNIGEWLESRLHLHLTTLGDDMYGDGRVSREERKAMSSAIGAALNAYRADLMSNASQLFKRELWANGPDSEDIAAMGGAMQESSTEADMSEQELKEAQAALAERDKQLAESQAALAKMQEQLLLQEARQFVNGKLAEAELPDITRTRLAGQLARNPAIKDGRLDEAEMGKRVETAVTEAQAEIAAITGGNGRITGMGESQRSNPLVEAAALAESQKRVNAALAGLGFGAVEA